MIKYIFFDVAGTLLGKPSLYEKFLSVLNEHNFDVSDTELKSKHKLISEVIHFPDRTDKDFYHKFNTEVLLALGIIPTNDLLDKLFAACSYLPWQAFPDTDVLSRISIPMGIISNFNTTLRSKLEAFFDVEFSDVFVSEEMKVAKPNPKFYELAVERVGVSPNEILYIGDSIKLDIIPAASIGLNTLLIDRENYFIRSPFAIRDLYGILPFLS